MSNETRSKPVVKGPVDGNIFFVVAAASKAMRQAGESKEQIDAMQHRVMSTGSYDEALRVIMEYVDFDLDQN